MTKKKKTVSKSKKKSYSKSKRKTTKPKQKTTKPKQKTVSQKTREFVKPKNKRSYWEYVILISLIIILIWVTRGIIILFIVMFEACRRANGVFKPFEDSGGDTLDMSSGVLDEGTHESDTFSLGEGEGVAGYDEGTLGVDEQETDSLGGSDEPEEEVKAGDDPEIPESITPEFITPVEEEKSWWQLFWEWLFGESSDDDDIKPYTEGGEPI
jgi:hypothetical protein